MTTKVEQLGLPPDADEIARVLNEYRIALGEHQRANDALMMARARVVDVLRRAGCEGFTL